MRKKNLMMSCCFSQQVKLFYCSQGGMAFLYPFYSAANNCGFTVALTIVKSGVWPFDSSGDLVNFCHLDSIFKFDSCNHLGQVVEAA